MTSNIIGCDNCSESIIQSLKKIETDEFQQMLKYIDNPYGDGNASKRIVEQIKMYFIYGVIHAKIHITHTSIVMINRHCRPTRI